ncbi:MAG: hypothetical protein ACK54C_09330, partial [Betaproteobacteria bacterium]
AVVIAAKQRRSSVGEAFRAIPATAEQFQTGDRPPLKLFSRDSDLVRLTWCVLRPSTMVLGMTACGGDLVKQPD